MEKCKDRYIDNLLDVARNDRLSQIKGFGQKTQANIIAAIEAYRSNVDRFHYASVADKADQLVYLLQQSLKTKLVSLCGEIRRQSTTVAAIEIIAAIGLKKITSKSLGRSIIMQSSSKSETIGRTIDEIPVRIYHSTKQRYYRGLFEKTGNAEHVEKPVYPGTNLQIYSPSFVTM